MAWLKIDDQAWMHPKLVEAGNAAAGAYFRELAYCAAYMTDGFVPRSVAKTIANRTQIERQLTVGLLRETTGGYVIPDYLEYNPSREEVLEKQAKRREAGQAGANARWHGKSHG